MDRLFTIPVRTRYLSIRMSTSESTRKLKVRTLTRITRCMSVPGKGWSEAHDLKGRRQFHAKKGQALIWAANLLHGGAAQTNLKRTRYSQVTHYYFDNCCYYTPMSSVPFLGPIWFRDISRYLNRQAGAEPVERCGRSKSHVEIYNAEEAHGPPDQSAAGFRCGRVFARQPGFDPRRKWIRLNTGIEFGYREAVLR